MSTRNVELIERVMRHIEDHPERHDQREWFTDSNCGTAACFAGWACLISGWAREAETFTRVISPATGVSVAAEDAATELLGLTDDETEILFHAANTRGELALMVKDLANGAPLRDRNQYIAEAGLEWFQ